MQNINSAKILLLALPSTVRAGVANKANNVAKFDTVNVINYSVEIDGNRYRKDSVSVDYAINEHLDE